MHSCDADPEALARYVLALLKKDKPMKELQKCMGEQLDVFLGQQTTPFITELFEVISSGVYLQAAIQNTSDATAEVKPNSIASPSLELAVSSEAVAENAVDILRQTASKALNDTQSKQNRRTSPVRASDNNNPTNNDNDADYVSGSF